MFGRDRGSIARSGINDVGGHGEEIGPAVRPITLLDRDRAATRAIRAATRNGTTFRALFFSSLEERRLPFVNLLRFAACPDGSELP